METQEMINELRFYLIHFVTFVAFISLMMLDFRNIFLKSIWHVLYEEKITKTGIIKITNLLKHISKKHITYVKTKAASKVCS